MKKKIGMELPAYGKVNLYLDVLSREENGYHTIQSVMQSVSLCDRVAVSATVGAQSEILLSCNLPYIPRDNRNIAYRAAALFLQEAGINARVQIVLSKRLPVAGGMAGGSTDAAAVLNGLNRVLGAPLKRVELFYLARKLGADVPFCLQVGTALCTGHGEIMQDIENRAKLPMLIVPSSESVSTPWAYGELDRVFGDFKTHTAAENGKLDRLTAALAAGDCAGVAANMYNIFEEAVLEQRPLAMRAKEILLASGAAGALMSGSGPTVFGIFTDENARTDAEAALKAAGYFPKSAGSC